VLVILHSDCISHSRLIHGIVCINKLVDILYSNWRWHLSCIGLIRMLLKI